MDFRVVCEVCKKSFEHCGALYIHKKWMHYETTKKCLVCDKKYKTDDGLKQHCVSNHRVDFTLCDVSRTKTLKLITKNLKLITENLKLITENLEFNTENEFLSWKEEVEKTTNTRYVKKRPSHTNKDGTVLTTFFCHRDGYFNSESTGKRSLKLQGSNKINMHCPARVKTKLEDNKIKVTYVKTHNGHENEIGRMVLSQTEKNWIASKIAAKIPLEVILDELRGSMFDDNIHRLQLTSRKDLHNIIRMYNLNSEGVLHKEDSISVDSWVREMQSNSNIIRLYKPQGCIIDDYPSLKKDDFCLILAKDVQLEMLKKYGNDILCIDGTHGTNPYDFELYTILVLDNIRQGFPCSFMITNRGDSLMMELYFKTILDLLGEPIKPRWFMSDDIHHCVRDREKEKVK